MSTLDFRIGICPIKHICGNFFEIFQMNKNEIQMGFFIYKVKGGIFFSFSNKGPVRFFGSLE